MNDEDTLYRLPIGFIFVRHTRASGYPVSVRRITGFPHLIKSGVRGKYVKRYREGTNIVVIYPELHKLFPDSEAVNNALLQYAKEHGMAA